MSTPDKCPLPDPYWAFYWPGGQGLTRFMIDNDAEFQGSSILDFGAGCGTASIAGAMCGAKRILSNDIDKYALVATKLNFKLNCVPDKQVVYSSKNFLENPVDVDNFFKVNNRKRFILLGDMFYDSQFAEILFAWLKRVQCERDVRILVGDPDRHPLAEEQYLTAYKTKFRKRQLAEYSLPGYVINEHYGFNTTKKQENSQGNDEEFKLEKTQIDLAAQSRIDKTAKAISKPEKTLINTENRAQWMNKFYAKKQSVKAICREFVSQRSFQHKFTTVAQSKNNDKCRYSDISVIDATRVILKDRPPKDDFIHANWMKMPDGFRYISTQGPLDNTVEDFWHMVYTEKATAIVMICDFAENNLSKCAFYIPTDKRDSCKFGKYTIKRIGKVTNPLDDIKMQVFEITQSKGDYKHVVNHYQYLHWPDHIAPKASTTALKLIRSFKQNSSSPVVVHCSAGIGRTATFVGIDYGSQRLSQNPDLALFDIVREMRAMRDKAVQTYFQYVFMIICITDLFSSEGVPRNEHMNSFYDEYVERLERNCKKRALGHNKSQDK
ncbi:unnamed protein product [Caenorhabditis bovis]|uniref:Protein-tyrosine-phosphatase n=1 Tax=Caenorhabditis bovis TaxID=2654633 RepID=A0A8S1F8R2_9PELO|nr:unnamed protein product [Caenorhabditis bovis]